MAIRLLRSLCWVLAGPEICRRGTRGHRPCCSVSSQTDGTGEGNVLNGRPPFRSKSDLTDADFFLEDLDTTLFPGVKSDVQAHNGFLEEHAKTAPQILAEVKKLISTTGATQVITVSTSVFGHRLGVRSIGHETHLPVSHSA